MSNFDGVVLQLEQQLAGTVPDLAAKVRLAADAVDTLLASRAEWVPAVHQALAGPQARRPMLRAPEPGDDFWPGALGYWSALLHLLVYGFGWSRPDRGLRWWYDAGRPADDPKLALLREIWDADGQLKPETRSRLGL